VLTTWDYLLAILMVVTAIFLILLILVQRGRGGGLAGALGGMGGQSAFGTKAGDLFTRITIGTALFWVVLLVISVKVMGGSKNKINVPVAPTSGPQSGEALKSGEKSPLPEENSADDKSAESKDGASIAPSAATTGPTDDGTKAGSASPPAEDTKK
jgi:preprotein translocase subunit SecG